MKRVSLFCLCLLLCLSLTGCGYKSDQSFTYILPRNISTLDPQTTSGSSAKTVIHAVFEGLCRVDEEGKAQPGVAKSWEKNEDSTQFTFHLRKNAKWSDGREVTSNDFLFAIRRCLRRETGTPTPGDLFVIRGAKAIYNGEAAEETLGVQAPDEHTLIFDLESSFPDFPLLTAELPYMPCNQAYFEESAGHYGLSSQYLLTNGPFTLESSYAWQTDSGKRAVSLVRSETYRGKERVRPESLQLLIDHEEPIDKDPVGAVLKGDVDVLPISSSMAESAQKQGCKIETMDNGVVGLLLNSQSEALNNISVRELFIKTLDRADLLSRDSNGGLKEASGVMPPCVLWDEEPYYGAGETAYAPQDDSLTQGIPSLLSMLELEQLPNITVICPDDERSVDIATGFLVSWNRKLGSAFNMEPLPESEFQSRIAYGDYDAALYTLQVGGTTPYHVLKAFGSSSSPALADCPAYDTALHDLTFSLTACEQLEQVLKDQYLFYPLFYEKSYYAVNPNVRDVLLAPGAGVEFVKARKRS